MRILLVVLLLAFSEQSFSQVSYDYELLNHMAGQQNVSDPMDPESVNQAFQAYFIKRMFLNSVYRNAGRYYSDDSSSDYGLVNELMMNQFANQLAEQNLFHFLRL